MESLQRSLEVLNNLNVGDLASMIWEQGPPPIGWAMDVYIRNGEIYFTDYYTTGTTIEYGPDEVLITTLDNTQGELDPTEVYTVGDTWLLPEEIIQKYSDQCSPEMRRDELENFIWDMCMTEEEKKAEVLRMLEYFALYEIETLNRLQDCIDDAIKEIQTRLKEEVGDRHA